MRNVVRLPTDLPPLPLKWSCPAPFEISDGAFPKPLGFGEEGSLEDAKGAGDPAGTIPAVHPPLHDLREDWKFGSLVTSLVRRPAGALLHLVNLLNLLPAAWRVPVRHVRRTCHRGCRGCPSPAGAWGSAHPCPQSPFPFPLSPFSLVPFVLPLCPLWRILWQSRRRQPAPNLPQSAESAVPPAPCKYREGAGGRRGPSPPDRPHPLRLRGKRGAPTPQISSRQ